VAGKHDADFRGHKDHEVRHTLLNKAATLASQLFGSLFLARDGAEVPHGRDYARKLRAGLDRLNAQRAVADALFAGPLRKAKGASSSRAISEKTTALYPPI
jgi:hypothetical protein